MMKRVLFVCHGNICRSPMAEFVLRDMAERAGASKQLYVESAAVSSEEVGNPVHPGTVRVLRAMGIPDAAIRESLRLSFNRYSSAEEIDRGADIFIRCIRKIRSVQSARTGPVIVYR